MEYSSVSFHQRNDSGQYGRESKGTFAFHEFGITLPDMKLSMRAYRSKAHAISLNPARSGSEVEKYSSYRLMPQQYVIRDVPVT